MFAEVSFRSAGRASEAFTNCQRAAASPGGPPVRSASLHIYVSAAPRPRNLRNFFSAAHGRAGS
jgi:hypothetical protein